MIKKMVANGNRQACRTLDVACVAEKYREEIRTALRGAERRPRLVGFLCTDDPGCVRYAGTTKKLCTALGMDFEAERFEKEDLDKKIAEVNRDQCIDGVMVYYPIYGDAEKDKRIMTLISADKDVEGLNPVHVGNVYSNVRSAGEGKPAIIPVTPISIIKILEYIGVYVGKYPDGEVLKNKKIAIINRSEVVGRPLAALLSNDGALVYSVDINNILEFVPPAVLGVGPSSVRPCTKTLDEVLAICDVVICGVPTASYKLRTSALKPGVVAINFSHYNNFNEDITSIASVYVPSIGKVTVTMLQRNLLKLFTSKRGNNM